MGSSRRGKRRTLITALTVDGFGPGMLLDEAIDRTTFDGSIIHHLAPTLQPDQIVVVDSLKVYSSGRATAAIEARGALLWYLPAYSPDLTPIEETFSKVKAALRTSGPRTVEAHSTAVWGTIIPRTPPAGSPTRATAPGDAGPNAHHAVAGSTIRGA